MPIRDCLGNVPERDLPIKQREQFIAKADELMAKGMSEEQAAAEIINEFHKQIYEELSTLKKSIGIKSEPYNPIATPEKLKEINDEYETIISNKKLELENAIPERSTETLPMGEGTKDSGTLGEGISQPKEPAGTQEESKGTGEKEKVKMYDLPFELSEDDLIRLQHEDTEGLYKEMGLDDRIKRITKNDTNLEIEANKLIKKWKGDIAKVADDVLLGKKRLNDAEQVAFAKVVGGLKRKSNELDPRSEEFNAVVNRIEQLSRASDMSGSETGAALRARQLFQMQETSLADYIMREKEASNVAVLTIKQKEQAVKEFEQITKAKKEFAEYVAKKEAELTEREAKAEVEKTKSTTTTKTKKTHDDYVSERKNISENIKEKLRKARGNTNVTIVPYANELIAIAPDVAKLMKSYIEEGISELGEIVKKIHTELKEDIPDIQEKDIQDIIAGKYNEQKKTRNEIAATLRDLRDEAKLITKLEELESGGEPKTERLKIERNQKIKDLRERIKSIRGEEAASNKFYGEEISETGKKLNTAKTRIRNQIKQLEEDLKAGRYETEKRQPLKLDKDGLELKDKLIKLKTEREIRLLKQKYGNRTKVQKVKDFFIDLANVPRAIMSSVDLSAPLRQGLWGVTSELTKLPIGANKGFKSQRQLGQQFKEMFLAAGSQKKFDRWFYDIKETPLYNIAEKSGLYIADPHNPILSAKEEQFMSNLAEKIPYFGKATKVPFTNIKVGGLIKGSERAYLMFLNKMRWDMFNNSVEAFHANGKTLENSPELYKAMADYINTATGRGDLGALEKSASVLNATFFSPRLIASRLKLLTGNGMLYRKVPAEVRNQYIKDIGRFIATGMAVLGLGKLAGAEVEDDPRSSDFGKMQFGDTRYDIWGGFQQYIRIISQMISGQRKTTTSDEIQKLNDKQKLETAVTFGRGKLAPVPSMALDFVFGKDVTGEPTTVTGEILKSMPMTAKETYESIEDQGVKALFTEGLPAAFGIGVQRYTNTTDVDEMISRAMNSKDLDQNKIVAYDKDGNERKITDDEFEKYIETRDKKIETGIKKMAEKGVAVIENGKPATKQFKDLTPKQVQDEIEKIKRNATKETKDELHPEPVSHKRKENKEQHLLEKYKKASGY